MNGAKIITFLVRLALLVFGIYVIISWYQMSLNSPERALSASSILPRAAILAGVVWLFAVTSRIVEGDA